MVLSVSSRSKISVRLISFHQLTSKRMTKSFHQEPGVPRAFESQEAYLDESAPFINSLQLWVLDPRLFTSFVRRRASAPQSSLTS